MLAVTSLSSQYGSGMGRVLYASGKASCISISAFIFFTYLSQVLKNELLSRNSMMENISGAGWELMESSSGERASHLQEQLETLNHSWQSLVLKVQAQQKILEAALLKVPGDRKR